MKPRRSLRRERLPLPLREGVGGRGPVPHDPSPRPPPSRGGGVSFLRVDHRPVADPRLNETAEVAAAREAPPPLEGGGRGEGSRAARPFPPTLIRFAAQALKGRGSQFLVS